MIVYDLLCSCGFQFEGWFKDRKDFQSQTANDLISCPVCQGNVVSKQLSAVAVRTKGASLPELPNLKLTENEIAQYLARGVQEFVKNNFDDVGANFANEALKIHFGAETKRNIRGVATAEEEKMLVSEGVELIKLPLPIEDDEKEPVN